MTDPHIVGFYSDGTYERDRLRMGRGQLELVRTQQLLRRLLPAPRARVLDIGGGPGTHAAWLAGDGYDVQLIDLVPELVEQAKRCAGDPPTFAVRQGDARELDEPDNSADVVLLLGPLYHLPERDDRRRALAQARRVLRPAALSPRRLSTASPACSITRAHGCSTTRGSSTCSPARCATDDCSTPACSRPRTSTVPAS
jgi:SAM-dependent methyltransferase